MVSSNRPKKKASEIVSASTATTSHCVTPSIRLRFLCSACPMAVWEMVCSQVSCLTLKREISSSIVVTSTGRTQKEDRASVSPEVSDTLAVVSLEDIKLLVGMLPSFAHNIGSNTAHSGPSMCPGADDQSLDLVLPFLRKVAAKDPKGRPCVGKAGTGGAGHYVKMIHNGIEHGMMSAISEAWGIMRTGLGLSEDEIGDIFEKWNTEGELVREPHRVNENVC